MNVDIEQLIEKVKSGTPVLETHGIELKATWKQDHGKCISGFANNEDGKIGFLLIGLDDKGYLVQKQSSDWLKKTEQFIANHLEQYLSPISAVQDIRCVEFTPPFLIIQIKNPGDVTTWNGRAYKRIGTSTSEMRPDEKLDLSLRLPGQDFSKNNWDGQVISSLVTEFANKLVEKNYPALPGDLSSISSNEILLRLGCRDKMASRILFGDVPVRIAYFDNNGDVISQTEKNGVFYLLSDFFVEEIQTWTKSKGTILGDHSISVKREPPYPPKALRECLANAVSHALYERNLGEIVVELHPNKFVLKNNCSIEVKGFAREWFSRKNFSKNKFLMQLLREAGFADELGSGKTRLYSQMLEAGKREPLIDFYEKGGFGCWTIYLYNEQNNEAHLKLLSRFKELFKSDDEARLAMALVLWRKKSWEEILEKLDSHYKKLVKEIIEDPLSPIVVIDNSILTKRWVKVALQGQDSLAFTSMEEEQIKKIIECLACRDGRNGKFNTEEARFSIGLSKTASEITQLSNLFRRWRNEGILTQGKKRGEWIYLGKKLYNLEIILPKWSSDSLKKFKILFENKS